VENTRVDEGQRATVFAFRIPIEQLVQELAEIAGDFRRWPGAHKIL